MQESKIIPTQVDRILATDFRREHLASLIVIGNTTIMLFTPNVCGYDTYREGAMLMSQLMEPQSSSPFRLACVLLNYYGLQYHCGKQISFCIHDRSILLLGHLDA